MLTGTQIEELVPVVAEYLQIQKEIQYLNMKQKENKEIIGQYLEEIPNETLDVGDHQIRLESFDVERLKSSKDTREVIRSYLPKRLSEKFFTTSTTKRVVVKE